MSDIGDIDSPRAATGGRPTRVDPKLFGKSSEFSGDRREWTDKALQMSLAMVCKNDPLVVVKTVTRRRGFGSASFVRSTGLRRGRRCTSTRISWSMTLGPLMASQILNLQKATGEIISDRLKCATVLSRSPRQIRTYLRVQNPWRLFGASIGADELPGGRGR